MKENITVVLVGLGGYAHIYVSAILDCPNPDFKVVGLVDPFPEGCARLEELRALGAPLYADIEDFYKEHTADLAVISTPIQFHAKNTITALSHGSNVLCEKPLCADRNDIPAMLAAQKSAKKFVDIGYQWSHHAGILEMKKDIREGLYGKPRSLKTVVLWPRDTAYFKRGTGWAGKIKAADGSPIYDSVANNATAHYLHNMFFVLGDRADSSLAPISTDAFLMRANPIENFDTCVIKCKMPEDVDVMFVASHAVDKNVNPVCEYRFEGGSILMDSSNEAGDKKDHFVGFLPDGTVKDYGNPQMGAQDKLFHAIAAARNEGGVFCPIEAAAVHTGVINDLQEGFVIHPAKESLTKVTEGKLVYVEGLADALMAVYQGKDPDLTAFCE